MSKSKLSEPQIVFILRQTDEGTPADALQIAERTHPGEHQAIPMSCRGKALDTDNAIPVIDNCSHAQVLVGIDASSDARCFGVIGHAMILSCDR